MSAGGRSQMKSESHNTPVSVPSDHVYGGATLSQRFHFRPYESVAVSDSEDAELPSPVSQPFLSPDGKGNERMYGRLGILGMIPVLLLFAAHWLLARWKVILFAGTVGTMAALLIFNMSRPEWRELAYYRYVYTTHAA